ncbi:MAG TPA: GNAT family N-acetyltransferase [Chloroflexota bacterium]|nr:GNAT family N-acetyltransferase [Chloroflexota bacterium]
MRFFLKTERLILRAFTPDDVDNLFDLYNDPDVMHFINGGRPTPREEIESILLPRILSYYRDGLCFGLWAAVEKSTGEFLGWFLFRVRDDTNSDQLALGYRLRKSAWGKGYATEGSRALIDKGFREQGVQRVTAETMVVNSRSRRVMEKCGLSLVRIFQQEWPDSDPIEGSELGDVEYAMTRAEWLRQHSAEGN